MSSKLILVLLAAVGCWASGANADTASYHYRVPFHLPVASPAAAGSLDKNTLSFGSQLIGSSSAPQSITLANTGNASLSVGAVTTVGDFLTTHNCSATLAAGSSCTLNTVFSPKTPGTSEGILDIALSSGSKSVSLVGTGIRITPLVSSTDISFGSVTVGEAAIAKTVTLTNPVDVALTGLAVLAPTGFAITDGTCGTVLAPRATCSFQLTFMPTAAQAYNGRLTINATQANEVQVNVSGVGAVETDPYFDKVTLLMHFDGGSLADVKGHSVTRHGTYGISAAPTQTFSKFGKGSVYFDGYGYLLTDMGTAFGTGDFTVEFWIYSLETVAQGNPGHGVFDNRTWNWPPQGGVSIQSHASLLVNESAEAFPGVSYANGTWKHMAITRQNGLFHQFVDGRLIGSSTGGFAGFNLTNTTVRLGTSYTNGTFQGYLDELRVTQGVARYTSDFTVPAKAFPNQ